MRTAFLLFLISHSLVAFTQDTGNIYFARKKMYTGTSGELKMFIDGKAVCKVGNNKYSIHAVIPGKHVVSVQFGGTEAKEKAMKEGVEIQVEAGKSYYLKAALERQGMINNVYLEEITAATWKSYSLKLEQDNCL